MTLLIRLLAYALIGCGGFIIVMNWAALFVTWRTGRFHSAVPLFGGVFCAGGLCLIPAIRTYAWAGIVADYSTLMLLYVLPRMIREAWETSRYDVVAEFRGQRDILTVRIRLFHHCIFSIEYDLQRPANEAGWIHRGQVGKWHQKGQQLYLQIGKSSALFEIISENETQRLRMVENFTSHEVSSEFSLESIDFQKVHLGAR